jgi:integrase
MATNKRGARGQMQPFTPQQVEMIAATITQDDKLHAKRDLALLRMAVDTMLRSVDVLKLTTDDVLYNGNIVETFRVHQQKTGGWVRCLLTDNTRNVLQIYLDDNPEINGTLFPICRRRYQQIVDNWCGMIRVDKRLYSTHSLRRTKAAEIYRRTKNICAVQKLLGHAKITHTQEYLGINEGDALDLARTIHI